MNSKPNQSEQKYYRLLFRQPTTNMSVVTKTSARTVAMLAENYCESATKELIVQVLFSCGCTPAGPALAPAPHHLHPEPHAVLYWCKDCKQHCIETIHPSETVQSLLNMCEWLHMCGQMVSKTMFDLCCMLPKMGSCLLSQRTFIGLAFPAYVQLV